MAIFGGTVPMVGGGAGQRDALSLAPALYLAAAGVVSFVVVLITHVLPEEAPP